MIVDLTKVLCETKNYRLIKTAVTNPDLLFIRDTDAFGTKYWRFVVEISLDNSQGAFIKEMCDALREKRDGE